MPQELADTAQQRLFIGVRTMAGPRTATGAPAHARMVAEADEPPCGYHAWLLTEREGVAGTRLGGTAGALVQAAISASKVE